MFILIAESKTMLADQRGITAESMALHTPQGEKQADCIMHRLADLPQSELIAETGFSSTLAAKLREMLYEFPNKALGLSAIEAFTGVVFKALSYTSLSPAAQQLCDTNVRIISSLYGLLRPDDIIKPYRLDFTTQVAPGGIALNSFWKKDVTIQLVKTIQEGGYSELLNLLPADAAKCVDWKVVKRFCKVWKVDFVEFAEGDKLKTPAANKLKTMRGKLLRQILCENISSVNQLKTIKSDDFICQGTPVYPDHLQFIC